jgi:hypothetical protein
MGASLERGFFYSVLPEGISSIPDIISVVSGEHTERNQYGIDFKKEQA